MAILSSATLGPIKTAGRYGLTIIGSVVATLAVVALFSKDGGSAGDSIKSIAESLGSIATALTALAGSAAALYAGARGTLNSTPDAIQASVANRPDKMVLTVDPQNQVEAAMRVAQIPDVKAVITSSEVAAATPQVEKIIAPEDPAAKS